MRGLSDSIRGYLRAQFLLNYIFILMIRTMRMMMRMMTGIMVCGGYTNRVYVYLSIGKSSVGISSGFWSSSSSCCRWWFEDYDCDGNVDDGDLGVTLVYKNTKRNMDFVGDFKKTRNIYLNLLFSFVQLGLKLHLSYSHLHLVNINVIHVDVCPHKI